MPAIKVGVREFRNRSPAFSNPIPRLPSPGEARPWACMCRRPGNPLSPQIEPNCGLPPSVWLKFFRCG